MHPSFKLRCLPKITPEIEEKRTEIQNLCVDGRFYIISDFTFDQVKPESEMEFTRFIISKSKHLSSLNDYPIIKKAFIKYNTSLCSSASVETLFSLAGFVLSPTRGNLSDTNFEKLIFLKGNEPFNNSYIGLI